jgi:hypothetical protein
MLGYDFLHHLSDARSQDPVSAVALIRSPPAVGKLANVTL